MKIFFKIFLLALLSFGVSFLSKASDDVKNPNTAKIIDKTSSAVETIYTDAKKTIPHINKALESLGEDLKVGATAVWDVLVKQQMVWSLAFLALTLSAIFNWYLYYRRNFSTLKSIDYEKGEAKEPLWVANPDFDEAYYKKYSDSYYRGNSYRDDIRYKKLIQDGYKTSTILIPKPKAGDELHGAYTFVHFISCLALSAVSVWNFKDMLTGFINPEFGALKTIAMIAEQIK